jgi:sugar phosphate isomerase/epimerase
MAFGGIAVVNRALSLGLYISLVAGMMAIAGGVSAAKAAGASGWRGDFQGPVGLQTWSLREEIKKDPATAVAMMKAAGFDEVEGGLYANVTSADLRKLFDHNGLVCTGMHAPYDMYLKHIDQVIDAANSLGTKAAGIAWIPHKVKGHFTREECLRAAADFNRFGAVLKQHGLTFYYHTHGYEFQPDGDGTLFDLLVAKTNPELVSFQMDIFWVVRPGQDPVKLLRKYPGRFLSLHLKDMQKGATLGELTGSAPKEWDVPLGTGLLDLPAILEAAVATGVKHYYIEDESAGAAKQIAGSLDYLKQVKFPSRTK